MLNVLYDGTDRCHLFEGLQAALLHACPAALVVHILQSRHMLFSETARAWPVARDKRHACIELQSAAC